MDVALARKRTARFFMAYHFPLAAHDGSTAHDDQMWFFEINHDGATSDEKKTNLHKQIGRLLHHPARFIKHHCPNVKFAPGPIVLVFQYGPFTNGKQYCIHGVDNTNVVSVRCPPLQRSETDIKELPITGTVVNVVHLENPVVAFAHFDPKEAQITYETMGQLVADPILIPQLLNVQKQTHQFAPAPTPGTDSTDTHLVSSPLKAKFVLSDSFRFRYEAHVSLDTTSDDDPQDDPPSKPILQCVKVGGSYSALPEDELLLVQIDEGWQMKWQEQPTP